MVIGGPEEKSNQNDDDAIENHDEAFENDDDDDGVDSNPSPIKQGASFLFSDSAKARITRVKCQRRPY